MKNGKYIVSRVVVLLSNGETVDVECEPGSCFYRVSENYLRDKKKPMPEWPHWKEHSIRWKTQD